MRLSRRVIRTLLEMAERGPCPFQPSISNVTEESVLWHITVCESEGLLKVGELVGQPGAASIVQIVGITDKGKEFLEQGYGFDSFS